jgi:hypothetical protein
MRLRRKPCPRVIAVLSVELEVKDECEDTPLSKKSECWNNVACVPARG